MLRLNRIVEPTRPSSCWHGMTISSVWRRVSNKWKTASTSVSVIPTSFSTKRRLRMSSSSASPFRQGGFYPAHSHCFGHSTHRRVTELTDATVEFGLIPHDHWYQPDWIDEEKASAAREQMAKNNVIYGGTHKSWVSLAHRLKLDLSFQ